LEGTGVTANCFHPGLVATRFSQNNGGVTAALFGPMKPFARRPDQGAAPLVWLADAPDAGRYTGQYFVGHEPARLSGEAADPAAAGRLWTETEAVIQEALGAKA
jgi:NAD(P)-dependent dehydrogenase (short-subunit alcohol dehydrogenase family)